MAITILRLGHRIFRDQRITTHCGLTARALGAKEMYYTGEHDLGMEQSLEKAAAAWGGHFRVRYLEAPGPFLRTFHGKVVHLTAYGLPFQGKLAQLRRARSLLVIVGGEKVPPEIYQRADWNLAVGSQPHSEVAALGIVLYELTGRRFPARFTRAKLRIVPQARGKRMEQPRSSGPAPARGKARL
ncbi:MAG: tRNA (cytidine(56)-2'-O)-methyltransferase [Candidatus Aenigmarchaeota archaeon]|nr:tRNA (cytidine(56)-2'-O)-methyltransferase [Candidatus Aenigmarchaeota archaeon]